MPLYEYRCLKCGSHFEKIQKFSDPPVATCEKCGGKVERLLSSPAIQFKGSGWYVTDYARKPSPESTAKTAGSSDGKGDKADKATPVKSEKTEKMTAGSSKKKDD